MTDEINAVFELGGAFLCWMNVAKLYKDNEVRGMYWPVTGFFALWGMWNLYYYSALNQWCSFFAGMCLCAANACWVCMVLRMRNTARQV
jgi:hypothetical protein